MPRKSYFPETNRPPWSKTDKWIEKATELVTTGHLKFLHGPPLEGNLIGGIALAIRDAYKAGKKAAERKAKKSQRRPL